MRILPDIVELYRKRGLRSAGSRLAVGIAITLAISASPVSAFAYDNVKVASSGMVRGDLSTWTQRAESFPQNKALSVNGYAPLSTMGCSYYATFFMLCRMGIKNPLKDTAWQLAQECLKKGLSREGTGYFDPRSISKLTDGRVRYVESGNDSNYYNGQAGVARCRTQEKLIRFMKKLMYKKGYFLVACCTGMVTNYQGEEYYSEGHYVFIDSITDDDCVIGDSAFPGTRWSDNWGRHGARIVKVYAYRLFDEEGRQVMPSERQSMYVRRSADED